MAGRDGRMYKRQSTGPGFHVRVETQENGLEWRPHVVYASCWPRLVWQPLSPRDSSSERGPWGPRLLTKLVPMIQVSALLPASPLKK